MGSTILTVVLVALVISCVGAGPVTSNRNRAQTSSRVRGPAMTSISVSKTGFKEKQLYYGHGGWFGYAPQLMSDPNWATILKTLLPNDYTVIKGFFDKGNYASTIKAMENNPVVAAYGYLQHSSSSPIFAQPFEWDSFFTTQSTVADPQVDSMLIAHGTPFMLWVEGALKRNTYQMMSEVERTNLGGSTVIQWRDLFVKAVLLGRQLKANKAATFTPDPAILKKTIDWPTFNSFFAGGAFKVVLDCKTGGYKATPEFLAAVVKQFAARGVRVVGVGSFNPAQITGLKKLGVEETLFFHGLRGRLLGKQLLEADPAVLAGKTVLFNGGFLIAYSTIATSSAKQASYKLAQGEIDALRALKKKAPGLRIGIYVQEYDVDPVALQLIMTAVGKNPDVFDRGFAWGGQPSSYYSAIKPSLTDATTGTSGQILFAKKPSA